MKLYQFFALHFFTNGLYYIPKGTQVTQRTPICIKGIKGEITKSVLKLKLSFLYGTHRHDPFYMSVKYQQNIPNGIQVIKRTQKCLRTDRRTDRRTDARLIAISLEPFGRGIKRLRTV